MRDLCLVIFFFFNNYYAYTNVNVNVNVIYDLRLMLRFNSQVQDSLNRGIDDI